MGAKVSDLLGKTLSDIERIADSILVFRTTEGRKYEMYHSQDCCESVYIEDIVGDLKDLIGEPLTTAEEVTNENEIRMLNLIGVNRTECPSGESETWTYYRFATRKGFVSIRWYGTSNGYYSESVDFCEITN